jgi:hypothetical protein
MQMMWKNKLTHFMLVSLVKIIIRLNAKDKLMHFMLVSLVKIFIQLNAKDVERNCSISTGISFRN